MVAVSHFKPMSARVSEKAARFTESVIREMTRLATRHQAINLAQGFPNFATPQWLKDAACAAIQANVNQYAVTWGAVDFRFAIAAKYLRDYRFEVDPEREITVACGATECMIATLLALVDPGQKTLIFEPFYENYGPDAIIAGASPVFAPLRRELDWSFDADELERLVRDNAVRALILNTPNNPAGKVFGEDELAVIARLARDYDFYVITDEIYEHIVYDGARHHLIATFPGMRDRTVTISGLSKTFSVTGWRLGYILAPADLTAAIRKMHDFLTVGAAAPLQAAAAQAMAVDVSYYKRLAVEYGERRDFLVPALADAGFGVSSPAGAYYVMADITGLTKLDDVAFVRLMIEEFGVAAVPGSSFYRRPEDGRNYVRFAFCKTLDLLEEAAERLRRLAG